MWRRQPLTLTYDVVIVGGGLFGSIIARAFQKKGKRAIIIDKGEPTWGSGPAACLIKPTWVSGLGKEVVDPAMAKLRELYDVKTIDFQVGPVKQPVWWVNPSEILRQPQIKDEVLKIDIEPEGYARVIGVKDTYIGERVVLAAGVWTDRLLPEGCAPSKVEGRAGVAFLYPDMNIEQPFIKPWAPFKQIVAFNRGDGLWVSDGTALKTDRISLDRENECHHRCATALGIEPMGSSPKVLHGIRPYTSKAKPCYFQMETPHFSVVTGGAKNGTLAAGWAAHKLTEHLS